MAGENVGRYMDMAYDMKEGEKMPSELRDYLLRHIPQKIVELIEKIPENGAVQVPKEWIYRNEPEVPEWVGKVFISKINGRIEFHASPKGNDDEWQDPSGVPFYWEFVEHPEMWTEHFEDENDIPRIIRKVYGVYL